MTLEKGNFLVADRLDAIDRKNEEKKKKNEEAVKKTTAGTS